MYAVQGMAGGTSFRRRADALGSWPSSFVDRTTGNTESGRLPNGSIGVPRRCVLQGGLGLDVTVNDLTEGVDRRVSDSWMRVRGEQLHRPRDEEGLAGTTRSLFASITCESVKGAGYDFRVGVVEPVDDVGDGLVIEQVVQDDHALEPDPWVRLGQAPTEGGHCRRSRKTEVPVGVLGSVVNGEVLDESVVVLGSGIEHNHRLTRYKPDNPPAVEFDGCSRAGSVDQGASGDRILLWSDRCCSSTSTAF